MMSISGDVRNSEIPSSLNVFLLCVLGRTDWEEDAERPSSPTDANSSNEGQAPRTLLVGSFPTHRSELLGVAEISPQVPHAPAQLERTKRTHRQHEGQNVKDAAIREQRAKHNWGRNLGS